MASSIYSEDTVALKADPSITGIVELTWRDVETNHYGRPSDWIVHSGITQAAVQHFIEDGQPPHGHVTMRFIHPYMGTTLIKEEDLILLDRAYVLGDVVKRRPTDSESGTVLKASETCLLEPIYTDLPYTDSNSWPHRPEDNRLKVPSEELEKIDWEEGDYIIFRDWIGEVSDMIQAVTVRLSNNTIVTVQNPDELKHAEFICKKSDASRHRQNLVKILKQWRTQLDEATPQSKEFLQPASEFWPGQVVFTAKHNLRLGIWKVGKYDASQPPRGVVVDVQTTELHVDWIASKLFDTEKTEFPLSPEVIEGQDLEEVRLYNKANLSSTDQKTSNNYGSRFMAETEAGDVVKFRDVAGAALKYSAESPASSSAGVFRRIPRVLTDGFDMNVFRVTKTDTTVRVQWQDGSITEESATTLIPYLNVDEHDVWPGEIVSLKADEKDEEGRLAVPDSLGVVQSVDAEERTARIRRFSSSTIRIDDKDPSVFHSGGDLGELSSSESTVALYDIHAHSHLSKRRGDLVSLAPNVVSQALRRAADMIEVEDEHFTAQFSQLEDYDTSFDPQNILSRTEVRWFGEIVDLQLDGLLTIRLVALDKVEDIHVSPRRVNVVIGSDDPGGFNSEGGSFASYDTFSESWTDEDEDVLEETFYEGGQRLDDGDDDAWMTDGEDSGDLSMAGSGMSAEPPNSGDPMDIDEHAKKIERTPVTNTPDEVQDKASQHVADSSPPNGTDSRQMAPTDRLASSVLETSLTHRLKLTPFSSIYDPFEILDGFPTAHRFLSESVPFTATYLRAIQREHRILKNSLPEGIWVRTWSDRLDLVEVLVLGPQGTPYSLAPFVFDFQFPKDYPASPPEAFFHSWTNGVGRVNPNLYEDGKICLSILGTWNQNRESEGWHSESTLLQVLVSLLGLVLVEQPYYNEAGFDALVGAEETLVPARIYAEKAFCLSKGFVLHTLTKGCGTMTEVAEWLYCNANGPKLIIPIVKEMQELLARRNASRSTLNGEMPEDKKPLSIGAEHLLRRFLPGLESIEQAIARRDNTL